MIFVRNVKGIMKDDVAIAGGKGASLGEMMRAGLPIPPGFVILAPAYEKFLKEKKMPEDVRSSILQNYKMLGAKKVAVRSSATAEDLKSAAWAGQLESYLNTTEKDLLKNVRKCWESLSSPRAVFYRSEKRLNKTKISVAVVVQKMVASEVSGVAFSVHPVTEDRNQIVIEAVFGLGEKLVSGRVTPDSYVIEKDGLKVIDINKEGKQKLGDAQIKELAKLILKIENHYEFPVDVEWAFAKRKFYIVQSRPITMLHKKEQFSHLPEIKSAEFWARESSMPLFWLTDTKHNLGATTLIFYKKKIFHFYHLNNSQKKDEEKGYKFFSKKGNVILYKKTARKLMNEIQTIFDKYNNASFGKLKTEDIAVLYGSLYEKLLEVSECYRKTESASMHKLKDTDLDFKGLAEIRFESRKSFSNLFYIFVSKLMSELARRNNLGVKKDLFFYDFDEINKLLKSDKKVEENKIKERRAGYAVIRKGMTSQFFSKKDADLLWKQAHNFIQPKNKTEIKGSIVFGGIIMGKARIISQSFNKKKIKSGYGIKRGEVLVTDMTKPDMIVACKKSSAIVTDEGGILCHAAIIARELKKPCIVGTKIATQILKTGDLVEVDAEEGIVRIIKKARRV